MIKLLISNQRMHNLYAIFVKILEICKGNVGNLVDELGNIKRRGVVPKFSDLKIIALSLMAEIMSIDSENNLFSILDGYRTSFPNMISRRQFNDRRKSTSHLCEMIRKRIADIIDGGENYFCIDSKPIEVWRVSRGKRCKIGYKHYSVAPSFSYCASQGVYYYGYKLHAMCGLSGVIHSYDLTQANVHDINYLRDVKLEYHDVAYLEIEDTSAKKFS
jgi:hypothetical protein